MGFQLDAAILPARQASLSTDKAGGVNGSQSAQPQEPSDFHKILGKENNRSQGTSVKSNSQEKIPDKSASSESPKMQESEGHESPWHEEGDGNGEFSMVDDVRLPSEYSLSTEGIDGIPIDTNTLSNVDDTTNEINPLDFVFARLGFLSDESTLHNKEQQQNISSFGLGGDVDEQEKLLSAIEGEALTDGITDLDSIDDITVQMSTEMKKPGLASGISLASVVDNTTKNKVPLMRGQEFIDEGILGEKISNKSLLDESTDTGTDVLSSNKNEALFDTLLSEKNNKNNRGLVSSGSILADAAQSSFITDQNVEDDTAQTTLVTKLAVSDIAMSPINGRVQVPINITFGQPQWANAIADRTAMLASQNVSFAELQLDPPELGPLTVKIQINQDQAVVNFVANSSLVKDSLEQNNQRLKDMFNEQGLNLADVDVSERQSGDQEAASHNDQDNPGGLNHDGADVDANEDATTVNHLVSIDTGVDDFA